MLLMLLAKITRRPSPVPRPSPDPDLVAARTRLERLERDAARITQAKSPAES
jgi:hypothetical protein